MKIRNNYDIGAMTDVVLMRWFATYGIVLWDEPDLLFSHNWKVRLRDGTEFPLSGQRAATWPVAIRKAIRASQEG